MKKRLYLIIKGRVQGVFYRASTRDTAIKLGLKGWVRNMPDGSVEALFEGEADKVENMLAWCHSGSPLSRVEAVEVREETCTGEFTSFTIAY